MDGFKDKLTQRISAQEMILANAAAEAKELELLKHQVEAYDELFRKMQEAGDINSANVVQLKSLLSQYQEKLDMLQEHVAPGNSVDVDEINALLQNTREQIESFSHKENVKVYRNVQAAVNDELNRKVQELTAYQTAIQKQCQQTMEQVASLGGKIDALESAVKKNNGKVKAVIIMQVIIILTTTLGSAGILMALLGII